MKALPAAPDVAGRQVSRRMSFGFDRTLAVHASSEKNSIEPACVSAPAAERRHRSISIVVTLVRDTIAAISRMRDDA
jgi:hypothetical protein